MALQFCKLCSLLLTEHFGEVVGKVAEDLQWGPKQVNNIIASTGISAVKVKKAISILVQYGFSTFEKSRVPWRAEYHYKPEKVLLLLRYPRYLSLIKKTFGTEAQLLFEEVLKHGSVSESSAIIAVVSKLKEGDKVTDDVINLRNKFHALITNQFLMRCANPVLEDDSGVPQMIVKESELYVPPALSVNAVCQMAEGVELTEDVGDKGVTWRVNFDRFHQDMRDELMVEAMRRRFDDNAAQLMSHLLQSMYLRTDPWTTESNPVPILELKEIITKKSGNGYLIQYFEQYIKIMDEDSSQFLSKAGVGDSSSTQVCVNLAKAFHELTCTAVENIIEQRYGPKAARIFRLVRVKKYIEQEQIQQLAMISDKEAKQITYKLLQENFLQMQELRKPTVSSGPNKSFFLFHVDINLVVLTVIEMSHKAVYNALIRRRSERTNHRRLMEKHDRIETVAQSMREQGTEEEQIKELVDEWLSPPERNLLESVEKMMKKLQLAELQIDNTLFLLQLFSYYQYLKMPKLTSKK